MTCPASSPTQVINPSVVNLSINQPSDSSAKPMTCPASSLTRASRYIHRIITDSYTQNYYRFIGLLPIGLLLIVHDMSRCLSNAGEPTGERDTPVTTGLSSAGLVKNVSLCNKPPLM